MKYLIILLLVSASISAFAQVDTTMVDQTKKIMVQTVEPFDHVAATEAYLNSLTPKQRAKSDAYFEGGYWLLLWGLLYSLFIAWVFISKGLSLKLKSWAQSVSKNTNLVNLIYIALYLIAGFILALPMAWYEDFYREHQYDLSNLTFSDWLIEGLQSLMVEVILFGVLFTVLYIAIRKTGQHWWKWGTGITVIFTALLLLILPIFIAPIFNDYKFLEDGPIKESILTMARANDVPVDNVYQFDASKQSDRISANVSGIANTIRISLNDNLLNRCNEAEIKAVMGHELGHYVLNHVYKSIIAFGLLIFVGFAFVNWGYHWTIDKWGDSWAITSIEDVTGLPLIMVLFSIFFFLAEPVTNNIIRINEVEADNYGLNAAREPDGFASTAMKLSEYRKIEPSYWEEIIFFDHPSGRSRVEMSMKWKAENLELLRE